MSANAAGPNLVNLGPDVTECGQSWLDSARFLPDLVKVDQ